MKKICINNRDELLVIPVDEIAYIIADGNYTKIVYLGGMQSTLSLGLTKVENIISQSYAKGKISPFIRLGRSIIINQLYLYDINLTKQTMTLTDCKKSSLTLKLPKALLKKYKEMVAKATV